MSGLSGSDQNVYMSRRLGVDYTGMLWMGFYDIRIDSGRIDYYGFCCAGDNTQPVHPV